MIIAKLSKVGYVITAIVPSKFKLLSIIACSIGTDGVRSVINFASISALVAQHLNLFPLFEANRANLNDCADCADCADFVGFVADALWIDGRVLRSTG